MLGSEKQIKAEKKNTRTITAYRHGPKWRPFKLIRGKYDPKKVTAKQFYGVGVSSNVGDMVHVGASFPHDPRPYLF